MTISHDIDITYTDIEKSSVRRQPPRRNTFFFLTFFGLAYRQRIESPCDEYEICLFDVCVVPCRANETIAYEFFA